MQSSPRRFRLALALVWLATACVRQPEPAVHLDLVESFPLARAAWESPSIAFGARETRPHLVQGWSGPVRNPQSERSLVWGLAPASELRFVLLEPRDLELELQVRPYRYPQAPRQEIGVELNGTEVARLRLKRRRLRSYRIGLPAEHLSAGENRLVFRYAYGAPADRNPQPLAAAWHRLELPGASGSELRPTADRQRRLLFVPYGTELSYFVKAPPESALRIEGWQRRGSDAAEESLVVLAEEDGMPARVLARFGGSEGPEELRLNEEQERLLKITLRALARGPSPEGAGVALRAPAIWAPAASEPASENAKTSQPAGRRPNILIYMIDTLRADRLGSYGNPRPVSPQIDAFAGEATLFENGVGQSSWTRASVASLFTGIWPPAHGAYGRKDRLSDEAVTLAELLQEAGYRTAAILANANVGGAFGFRQGFGEFHLMRGRTESDLINRRVFAWLDAYREERPFFLYVHTVDPHHPYLPPEPYMERFAPDSTELAEIIRRRRYIQSWPSDPDSLRRVLDLYDAEVAFNDASFGELVEQLRQRDLYGRTVLALISDHGEEFHDHGRWTHGKTLHAETLNFPFILRLPDRGHGLRLRQTVQHTDLLPTLLDYLGLPIPPHVDGRSLLAAIDRQQEGQAAERPVFSHLHLDADPHLSVVDGEWKYIQLRRDGVIVGRQLFHWPSDPQEQRDLLAERPVLAGYLEALIQEKLLDRRYSLSAEEAVLDPETVRNLRALGYLK